MEKEEIGALVKKEETLADFETWLAEKRAAGLRNRVSPWIAVIIGISAFFMGALIVAVIFLGVYVISMSTHKNVSYRYESSLVPRYEPVPEGYGRRRSSAQEATPRRVPRSQVATPPGTAYEGLRQSESLSNASPALEGRVKVSPGAGENVTEVPKDYIMLKPPKSEGSETSQPAQAPKEYPAVPEDPYSVPPGVVLEKGQ